MNDLEQVSVFSQINVTIIHTIRWVQLLLKRPEVRLETMVPLTHIPNFFDGVDLNSICGHSTSIVIFMCVMHTEKWISIVDVSVY